MFEQCKAEFQAIMTRIEKVIKNSWPETLSGDGGVWRWLDAHKPDLRTKLQETTRRLNVAWQNGMLDEVKRLALEWGRLQLEIFKGYALHLKETA